MERRISYFRQKGDSYIFAASLGLLLSLMMVAWIVVIILVKGLGFFWPRDVVAVTMTDGEKYMGEHWEEKTDKFFNEDGTFYMLDRFQLKIGNRDLYGLDFKWLKNPEVQSETRPEKAVVFERLEYGNFYGTISELHFLDKKFDQQNENLIEQTGEAHEAAVEIRETVEDLKHQLALLAEPLTQLQREINILSLSAEGRTSTGQQRLADLQVEAEKMEQEIATEYQLLTDRLTELITREREIYVVATTADGREKNIQLSEVVRFYLPNSMGVFAKSWHYLGKVWEFVADDPRESNTEGGVFPAIFGTVMMVILMSIAVVPFGVMAAIYLNEYAKQGPVTRFIRLSVNNLAGVPSIVFGVFGLGFFVYFVGGGIDQFFFSDKLPEPTFGTGGILWASLTLALLTLPVVVVATEEGLLAVPRANKEGALALGSTRWQMIRKVVLPNAMPGILTGLILAISRGAGEVAPLMITGVVKLAPTLALDGTFPFLHLDRKFMHLGFHIYDVGFQSPNVEAAKPMVYSTALLLILIVILLNLIAIYVRNNLRKKFKTSTF